MSLRETFERVFGKPADDLKHARERRIAKHRNMQWAHDEERKRRLRKQELLRMLQASGGSQASHRARRMAEPSDE